MRKYRFALIFGAFSLLFGGGELFAQGSTNPCGQFKVETVFIGFAGYCYFDAYAPWLPVGTGFNAEINIRNPKTADTTATPVAFSIMKFYPKGGSTAPGSTSALVQIDGGAPESLSAESFTLNPGEKRDILILDECFNGEDLSQCNNVTGQDKNPSISAWIRVYSLNPVALSVQGLLQFQDFTTDGKVLTMDKFRPDYTLSWEWQGRSSKRLLAATSRLSVSTWLRCSIPPTNRPPRNSIFSTNSAERLPP